MKIERSEIMANLPKKGFVEENGRKHIFFHFTIEGKKTPIRTHVSHGSKYKTLGDDLVSAMAKQCKVTSKNFCGLAECTISEAEYIELLEAGGHIDPKL